MNEKFVFVDKDRNKYLLKTVLYHGDPDYHCDKCYLNNNLCEELIDLTGDCYSPNYIIFTCVKIKKHTHESKT